MPMIMRNIEPRDRDTIFRWVESLGWNPGEKDGDCLLAVDPSGMFMVERDGRPVGCATAIAYDDRFGFVGALVVDPALRGKAPSTLWSLYRHVKKYLGNRMIGVDVVPATQAFFTAAGCRPAYRHLRFEGLLPSGEARENVVPLSSVAFDVICDYDAAHFPVRREHFLRIWLEAYGAGGWACLRNGRLAGFGLIRRARQGWRIGPLLADDPGVAVDLLRAMGTVNGGESVFLDVPEASAAAMDLVRRFGFTQGFETTRMYLNGRPGILPDRIYSIASYETG